MEPQHAFWKKYIDGDGLVRRELLRTTTLPHNLSPDMMRIFPDPQMWEHHILSTVQPYIDDCIDTTKLISKKMKGKKGSASLTRRQNSCTV